MGRWTAVVVLAGLLLGAGSAAAADGFSRPYGALKSDPVKVRSLTGVPEFRAYLPEQVDLSGSFPVPGDQGNQGSCTGWAVGYAARAYYAVTLESRRISQPGAIPSPAFLYNQSVGVPGDCNSGSSNYLILDELKNAGALSLADYPYDQDRCDYPNSDELARATDFRIDDYRVVDFNDLDRVKGELADGNPVIIRIVPDDAFDRLWDQPKGVWHSPPLPEDSFGHAITLVGYNEAKQTFKFINSWGPTWSDNGYGRMDYQTFLNRTTEAFVMVMPPGVPNVPVEVTPEPDQPVEITPVDGPVAPPVVPAPEEPIVPEQPVHPADPAPRKHINLAGLQCGRVDISTRGSRKVAEGFVATEDDLAAVEDGLKDQVDEVKVDLAPWPQCEALETLDSQLRESEVPEVGVSAAALKQGDTFSISVTTPDFDSYVHAAYVQADGTVVNLMQVDADHLTTIPAHTVLKFGDGQQGRDQFEVSGPFGNEMLLVISSRAPLFSEPRPETETERAFLSALREAILARPDKSSPERFISAAYVPITTAAN